MFLPRSATLRFTLAALALLPAIGGAQRHSGRSAPATAPVPPPPQPIVPVSSGLGAIQFSQVSYGVPAPQALTRQLRFDDDRTRAAALSAIGAPGQYLQHGHIPMPRSIDLQLVQLGTSDDLDALLTVELEQHIVTAVLVPADGNWRRVATLLFSTSFYDPSTTPSTWIRISRSLAQPERYRAIFHASSGSLNGNFTENEAHLSIINNKAIITISFESTVRECSAVPPPPAQKPFASKGPMHAGPAPDLQPHPAGCTIVQRWFQPDPADPAHLFDLITGVGHITPREAAEPFANARNVLLSHLRFLSCQPYNYSESSQHFEPTANAAPCRSTR